MTLHQSFGAGMPDPSMAGALLAFDTGPANAPINDLMRARLGEEVDEGGALAAKGMVDETIVERFLAQNFFFKIPPKSLDRNDFNDLLVDVAHHEAVLRLVGRKARPAPALADPKRLHQAPRLEIRAGGVEDLALALEIVERAQHLLERRLMVDVMDVVDVDVVGLQPLQRSFDLLLDVQPRHARIVGPASHRIEELRGDDGVLAPALQRHAQHRLRHAADIGVSRVEEVHA